MEFLLILLIKLTLASIVFAGVLNFAGLHTWVERKQSALIQDRIGANRADIFGFHFSPANSINMSNHSPLRKPND